MTFTKKSLPDHSRIQTKHLQNLSGEHFRTNLFFPVCNMRLELFNLHKWHRHFSS